MDSARYRIHRGLMWIDAVALSGRIVVVRGLIARAVLTPMTFDPLLVDDRAPSPKLALRLPVIGHVVHCGGDRNARLRRSGAEQRFAGVYSLAINSSYKYRRLRYLSSSDRQSFTL